MYSCYRYSTVVMPIAGVVLIVGVIYTSPVVGILYSSGWSASLDAGFASVKITQSLGV